MNKRIRLHHLAILLGFFSFFLPLHAAAVPTDEKESLAEEPHPDGQSTDESLKDAPADLESPAGELEEESASDDAKNKISKEKVKSNNDLDKNDGKKADGTNKDPKKNGKDKNDKNGEKGKNKGDKTPKKGWLVFAEADSEFKFSMRLRMPEFFYGKNLRLLNDENPTDRVVFFRHTVDLNSEYRFGRPTAEYDLAYFKMTIRNRGVWGDPESISPTTLAPIREVDAVFGEHKHYLPRHFLWIREMWLQLSVNDLLCLPFCNLHTFTFGAFPFELGRGIALGPVYALDPSDLGFWLEPGIDQYAFGGKLSGDIIKDQLIYDLYGAVLNNLSDTFDNTNQKIRGQEFGFREDQARGFGVINYVVAARLIWFPKFRSRTTMRIEPYILYNHNPEQRIEFVGDARSDLCTIGLAGEFEFGTNFECGFDTAFNFGHQKVFGWDRNVIRLENRGGTVVIVNSQVRQAPPGQMPNARTSPLALKVPENQNIINTSAQAGGENGMIIGTNTLGTLINTRFRFTEPSINKYRGMMFVYDLGYFICKPDLKVCAGFGYASGDRNPNRDLQFHGDSDINQVYEGFIGLQEGYAGIRVKSAYLLNGSGRIPRVLSFPTQDVFDPFPVPVNRFTNLVFSGASAYWRPSWSCRKWSFNPNIIAFWTDFTSRFFDEETRRPSRTRFARNYLGLEINAFIEAELLPDLKLFGNGAIFIPGGHYEDISGRPLNRAQRAFLDNLDVTGIINDRVPLLGHDKSYFINMGLEYRF